MTQADIKAALTDCLTDRVIYTQTWDADDPDKNIIGSALKLGPITARQIAEILVQTVDDLIMEQCQYHTEIDPEIGMLDDDCDGWDDGS